MRDEPTLFGGGWHRALRIPKLVLDVLDPTGGVANDYAVAGGVCPDALLALIDECRKQLDIGGATVSAIDPDADDRGTVLDIGMKLIQSLFS